ncbi:MAG TPA: hypothetical protein VNC50_00150, partial [Planctomycetia bacterium]|nr:hypothetical protein [Planctomycetia bacterium]
MNPRRVCSLELLSILFVAGVVVGCGESPSPSGASPGASPPYGFSLLNRTGARVENCVLEWGERRI